MDIGLVSTRPGIAPAPSRALAVEITTGAALRGQEAAWRSLAARAAEPTPFDDPETMLGALQHLANGRDVPVVVARRGLELQAVIPVLPARHALGGEARLWRPDLLPPLPPLVTRERTAEVIEAVLDTLGAGGRRFARLSLAGLDADGPLAAALVATASGTGRGLVREEGRGIPVLPHDAAALPARDARRATLEERLGPLGPLRVERGRTPRQVRDGIEILLTLDAGTASRRRPALIADPGRSAFLRTATRRLAAAKACRADILWAGDRPIAAALVALRPGTAWLCRLAVDPAAGGDDAAEWLALDIARGFGRLRLDLLDMRPDAQTMPGAARRPTLDLVVETRPGGLAPTGFGALVGRRLRGMGRGQSLGRA
ncbi:GNAT family N-acetyltransferase [Salinarimonas soli]|uniref:GNAT family N-acetyltransferase n=1 Tax=Salinarimonas soli TaxID=1638099 RepID=A0A5B2VAP1_9HYPH|nr:GNAT family N-acetyltransferase [Salinarimonas soli]KAA2235788.1 GNAT family N-acetyltransferase [Salinarimonas soli]